jgi:hypothetical protein
MEKIPTIFQRGPDFRVVPEWKPECEWVASMSFATEKLDGTNVRVVVEADDENAMNITFYKRRNPSKEEKAAGAEPGYVQATVTDPADKHIWKAFAGSIEQITDYGEGEYFCEAVGPKIQGNPLGLPYPRLVCFATDEGPAHSGKIGLAVPTIPISRGNGRLTYESIRSVVLGTNSVYQASHGTDGDEPVKIEGLVFHHADGRMAKIKRKDFREDS